MPDPLKQLEGKKASNEATLQEQINKLEAQVEALKSLKPATLESTDSLEFKLAKIWDQAIMAGFIGVYQHKGLDKSQLSMLTMHVFSFADEAVKNAKLYFDKVEQEMRIAEANRKKIGLE